MPDVEVREPHEPTEDQPSNAPQRETTEAPEIQAKNGASGSAYSTPIDAALDDDGMLDEERFVQAEGALVAEENWSALAQLYAEAAKRAPEAELGRRIMLSAGLLCAEKLEDPRRAEPFVRRVLASDPEAIDALDCCRAICLAFGRHAEAADLIDQMLEVAAEEDRPALLMELAQLVYEHLKQTDRALEALGFANELAPGSPEILSAAREIFLKEERWADAKRVLDDEADLLLGAPTSDEEFEAKVTQDVLTGEAAEEVKQLAENYRSLGVRLLQHAALHELAGSCLQRARALGDEEALSKLDELAALRTEWEKRAAALRDEGFEARDKRLAAQLYLSAAELYGVYGKDPIRADEYIERCLILSPGYPPALRYIEHVGAEDPSALSNRLNGIAAQVKDSETKVQILLRVADLLDAQLRAPEGETGTVDVDGLSSTYRRALAIQPGHPEAVGKLGALLEESGRHADRAQVLEGQLAAVDDDYLKSETHLELGRIYAEMLGDEHRARAHFEAVLALSPHHVGAASALRALYKDAKEHPLHLNVLKVLVDYSPDLFTRLEMLHEMVEVAAQVSREEEFAAMRQIFELDANASDAKERLEGLAEQLGRHSALADTYAQAASRHGGAHAATLWAAAGRLYDTKLPKPTEAINAYKRALRIDQDNKEYHDTLERLLRQQDDPEALVEVLRTQLRRAESEEEQRVLSAKIGEVLDRELGDLPGAIEMFQSVLEGAPTDQTSLLSLDDLYRRAEDWPQLEKHLVRREACTEDKAELDVIRSRRARLLDQHLERREEAASVYLDVLSSSPGDEDVIAALEELLSEGIEAPKVAAALEPIFAAQSRHQDQLGVLSVLAEQAESPAQRVEVARRAAELAETKLDNLSAAFKFQSQLVTLAPEAEGAERKLLSLADALSAQAAAAETLTPILERKDLAPEVVSRLATALGDLYDGPLSDRGLAIDHYRTALSADGSNTSAISALERLLGAEQRYQELAALLEERIERAEEKAAKVQLGMALAQARDEHLQDLDGAITAYREVLGLEPQESTALSKLAEALERKERFAELVGVLERIGEASTNPQVKAASEVRAGDVQRLHLRDKDSAFSRYERALSLNEDHEGAILGLEALLEDPQMRPKTGALLAPSYERQGRWRELVIALEAQLSSAEPDDRKPLYVRLAKIQGEQLEDPQAAFEVLSRAFKEGLSGAEERAELGQLALKANKARALAQLLEDALERSPDDVELSRELARLYEGAAAEQSRAKQAWERLLQQAPGDPEALDALERLTAEGDNPNALAEVLVRKAEAAPDANSKVAFLKRASAIYEELAEDLPKACEAMERAKESGPDDRTTWQELQRLYALLEQPRRVKEALVAEVRLIEEPLQRANTLVKLAEQLIALEEPEEAIKEYEEALKSMPEHEAARAGLEGLLKSSVAKKAALALEPVYRAAGDWAHLVDAYEILASTTEDQAERVERLVAIRSIYEERLGRPDRAFSAASRAYTEAPDNAELLTSLERLARLSGSVEELLALLEDQAEGLPYVSEERHNIRVQIARFTESLLQDRLRCIEAWRRVLEERPDALVALQALERHYQKGGEAREQVDVLRAIAGQLEAPEERSQKLLAAAQILEEKLGDRPAAAHLYEQVVMFDPQDARALSRLDALYSDMRAFEELARVLKAQVQVFEGEDKAKALLRLGQLQRTSLQDPRGALKTFAILLEQGEEAGGAYDGAVFALDDLMESLKKSQPELSAEAATLLEPHWSSKGMPLKVVACKEARVAAAEEPSARRALLMEVADRYETELDQPEMAFLAVTRAYSEFPNDHELATMLERLATAAEAEEELAELYAQVLPSIEDEEFALRIARRTAHIFDSVLGRGEQAVPYYNRVLAIKSDDASALNALERIHRRAGNAQQMVEVYRGMLRLTENDPEQQKSLWSQIAQLMEDVIGDDDGAFEAYKAMTELDPEDAQTLRLLAGVCERSGRLGELAEVFVREAELAKRSDDKAQVFLKLATLKRDKLEDPVGAVEAYGLALEQRRADPGAIAGLASILRSKGGEGQAQAAQVLAPVYRESGAFEEYISCLEAQERLTTEREDRKALLSQIAQIYEERLGRPEHAFTYCQRALHEDLFDEDVRERVERLAKEHGLFEELAGFYLDELDAVTDHDLMLKLRRRVADIYDKELRDVSRAISEYNKIMDVAPGDAQALRALERLYKEAGSFGSLADVYRRRIAQTDDEEARVSLLREFARLQSQELKDAPGAIATLRRLLELRPSDVDALFKLSQLCEAQGRASELSDVLERLIDAAEDNDPIQIDAKFSLSRLKAERLGDLGGADQLLREVLTASPAHEEARDFLQERFEDAVAEDDAQVASATGEILADAMRASGEWQPLISVLRVRAQQAQSSSERVPLNREIADIYREHLDSPQLAFGTLSQVYVDAPGIEEVRAQLETLADELLLSEELVEVLESGLPKIVDTELAGDVERRIAQLIQQKLGDRERAASAWNRVLARRPMDAEGLEATDQLNQGLGRWAAQTDILEKRIEIAADDVDLSHELMVRLGAIWDERLEEREEAIAWYRKARNLKPEDRECMVALSRLLDSEDDAGELFEVLGALVEQTKSGRERVRLQSRMAELAGGPLLRPVEGIELWQQVLETDRSNERALKGLEELLEREGRWQELADLLEREVESARDEKEVIRLQRRLGLVKGTRLGSVDEAIRSWSEILKRNPNDVEALGALRQIHRDSERWEDLVSTLRKLIPLQLNAEGVKSIRFELAEVFLSRLDKREDAIESGKRVLDVEPHTIAELMRLEEIFVSASAYGEAVKVMNLRAEQAESQGEQIDILFEIASIYEAKIHRRAGAASAYEKILALEPGSAKAYDALAGIYEGNGDYRKLVELINRRLETTEEVEERRRLLFEIVDVQERWLGQPELAFTAACRAFAEEGADERAQNLAERLADETDNWEILAEVYEEQVEQVGVARAVDLRRRLGEIYLERLDDPASAEQQLEMVLSMRPEDEAARNLLSELFEKQERWRDLIAQLSDKVELATTGEEKKQLFKRMAEIEEDKLQEIEGAISHFKRILDLEPRDLYSLSELARIFRSSQKWHPLLNILQRKLDLANDDDTRVRIRFEIAGVWEQGIEDIDQAIECYGDVLALDSAHLPSLKAMERLYTGGERYHDLIRVFERQVELSEDEEDAIGILTKISGIYEDNFRDLEMASGTLIRVLEINPEHLPTIKSLERIWRADHQWKHLVDAYERHIELIEEDRDRVDLHMKIGEIYQRELEEADQAEEAYTAALELDGDHRPALHALGQLHERHGNWFNALEMLQREASIVGPLPESVEIFFRMGTINLEMLADRDAAKEAFGRALEIDPSYSPAIRAVREMYQEDGNFRQVISLTSQEAEYAQDPQERAELYTSAADAALDHFDDVDQAIKLYELALEASPSQIGALRVLSDLYFGDELWEKAEKLLERLVEQLDGHEDQEELCRAYYRLAYIAEKLSDDHLALKRYLASYELDTTYLPTLEGLAAALLRAERWEDAQRILQTILIQHKSSLTDAEVVDLYYQLGDLAVRLDQVERATKSFKKALALDPDHVFTLRAYAELCERLDDWEESYDLRERLIGLLQGDDRFEELVRQANLCRDKIKEPYRAIDAYSEAKRLRPDDVRVLRALVRLFDETSQTPRTLEALNDLAKVLPDAKERRDAFMELARIYHEQQGDTERAVSALNSALDLDPLHIKAFEQMEQILFQAKRWPALEENYHRMIKRMPKEQKRGRAILWKSLGDLYLKVLKNLEGARVAYEVVTKLQPENTAAALTLADIYGRSRETVPQAASLYHSLLSRADDPAVPARWLFSIYSGLKHYDRWFCSAGALTLMRAATEDEIKIYDLLLRKAKQYPERSLTDELWRKVVLHPDCRNSLADVMSLLYRGAPDLFSAGQRELQIKKKERVDLEAKGRNARVRLRYFDIWRRLHAAMNVGEMVHVHRVGTGKSPELYPGPLPVLFAGEQHESFKAMPPRQIAWVIAREMAFARPELAMIKALSPQEVGAAVEAALQLFTPDGSGVNLNLDQGLVRLWKKNLQRHLHQRAVSALRGPVEVCLRQGEMRHLPKYFTGAEHSASRAALLMAGDVVAAERGLSESNPVSDVSFRARIRALMLYTLSEEHLGLREKLGLAIST